MKIDIDAYSIGLNFGQGLKELEIGLNSIEKSIKEQLNVIKDRLNNRKRILEKRLILKEEKGEILNGKSERFTKIIDKIEIEREEKEEDFSLFRGVFYVLISIILIAADVSLLGRVLAELLGFDWRSDEDKTFTQHLFDFENFGKTFDYFPDLLPLTISILLIGFFYKAWSDLSKTMLTDYKDKGKYEKLNFWVFSFLLGFSILVIILIAFARFSIDFGAKTDSVVLNLIAFFLGFTLPLVGVGFFIKGSGNLGKRIILCQYIVKNYINSIKVKRSEIIEITLIAEIEKLNEELNYINSGTFKAEQISKKETEFTDGYLMGVESLFRYDKNDRFINKITPILIREYLK